MDLSESGGFLPDSLPSPSPSNASVSSTSSNLPQPRTKPLRAGSAKEQAARRYVENKLLHISRRYAKKFEAPEEGDTVIGYVSMNEVAKDLSEIIDVLWLSGTRMYFVLWMMSYGLTDCYSEFTNSIFAKYCSHYDYIPHQISSSTSYNLCCSEKARSCIR